MSRELALAQPARIHRQGTKGWRAPDRAVYVGRGTRWGNPYKVVQRNRCYAVLTDDGGVIYAHRDETEVRRVATDWYRAWFSGQPDLAAAARRQLAGRPLMCWCPLPEPGDRDHCHAAVLLAIANEQEAQH
ncbi:DUF4326 domain-containing protein [Streptomyces sp. NPDC088337]|uniref:DUF4326 domain-containing protein n=1 Tax=unclassified Streptomyces TaxID=2593676 RepID=UPI0038052FC6